MPKENELLPDRSTELAKAPSGKLYRHLLDTFRKVHKGFQDQEERADDILDYWDCYNCVLNENQVYNGDAQLYVPIIANAVEARNTKFLNQIFPSSGRYIDATSTDGGVPHAIVALLESYIRNTRFRTEIVGALLTNGDLEGHYNLEVDWDETERHVVSRETRAPKVKLPGMKEAIEPSGEDIEDIREETIVDAYPCFEVHHDSDILVLPQTAKSIDDALRQGGSVTIIKRWTKETIELMIDREEVNSRPAKQLLDMSSKEDIDRSVAKHLLHDAGIRGKHGPFTIYETWECLDVPGQGRRLCRSWYGGYDLILSARRNPYWNDRCSLISAPIRKVAGQFKGVSPFSRGCDSLQYHANDVANEGADSATRALLPIIRRDPARSSGPLLLNLGAIWSAEKDSIEFMSFPPLFQHAIPLIQADTAMIFQTVGVNPAMLPQQTGRPGARRNQAEVALEQSVDLLQTSVAVSMIEEGILTPTLERMIELDAQFRSDEATVKMYGDLGVVATMERVELLQSTTRFNFTWFGVEQARNASQYQQMIAFLNIAASPPMAEALLKSGFSLNPGPALEHAAGNIFGWRMGRQIIRDAHSQLSMDPEMENELLLDGFDVPVNVTDDDIGHIQSHDAAEKATGDPKGTIRPHKAKHLAQAQLKSIHAQSQMGGAGMQQPGGGAGGGPQPGAQPQGPKFVRGPPGAIHADQMPRAGATPMPRKM